MHMADSGGGGATGAIASPPYVSVTTNALNKSNNFFSSQFLLSNQQPVRPDPPEVSSARLVGLSCLPLALVYSNSLGYFETYSRAARSNLSSMGHASPDI